MSKHVKLIATQRARVYIRDTYSGGSFTKLVNDLTAVGLTSSN